MVCRRGEIYLANLNPSKGAEPGKVRPCMVLQSDFLNEVDHPTVTVIPLTTNLSPSPPLRFRINKRALLRENSDLILDQVRTIDRRRLVGDALARLSNEELFQVEEYLSVLLGFHDHL